MNLIESSSSIFFGTLPVPIDQTGSYAIKRFVLLLTLFKQSLIYLDKTDLVFPLFFSEKVSPIHKITFNFALIALLIF